MAVITVIFLGDQRELAHLTRRQGAVRDGDPQHIGMKLKIDAVHLPEQLELFLVERAVEPTANLITKLGDPLADQLLVEFIIAVHQALPASSACLPRSSRTLGPRTRRRSR